MNKYVMNTKKYKHIVDYGSHASWKPMNFVKPPSCFYDFAGPQYMEIGGYCTDSKEPSELFNRMRQACEDLQ